MTKAKTIRRQAKEPPPKVHKLDSSNPKLKYIGGSSFDAWNNTIVGQAAGSIWHGHNPDADRVHEREVASLNLLAAIRRMTNLRACWRRSFSLHTTRRWNAIGGR